MQQGRHDDHQSWQEHHSIHHFRDAWEVGQLGVSPTFLLLKDHGVEVEAA